MASICLEEYELLGDSKYRSYVTSVDKALRNFESTNEWADLISALAKLNKVLSSHMRYPVIPKRLTIGKRLAQCMHHALPAGVHLKAIETYDIIFKCLGTNRLSQELFVYSAGLFPLLGHASMNVKPALLTIYETHFVPLRERLRPGLHGFLVGILPALEETSEYCQRTTELLEQICEGTDPSFFYGALWDCVISNPGVRLTAVDFALNHYNRKLTMEDQLYMIGTSIDTMVKALCLAVQDGNILVQRSTLDLLQLCFPMHNSQLLKSDMSKIVTAAILVILRRDMSVNRRLFGWVLGLDCPPQFSQQSSVVSNSSDRSSNDAEGESSASNAYFETHSRELVVEAMINCLKRETAILEKSHLPDLWCYRLLQSLLDKPDIAGSLLDEILIQVFRALYHDCNALRCHQDSRPNKHSSELLKAANVFFSTLEPEYMWTYIGTKFASAAVERDDRVEETDAPTVLPVGSPNHTLPEICLIVNFLLDILTLETCIDSPKNDLPRTLKVVCNVLAQNVESLTAPELTVSLSLCSKLLSKIQPSVDESPNNELESPESEDQPPSAKLPNPAIQECIASFQLFFVKFFEVHIFIEPIDIVLTRTSDLFVIQNGGSGSQKLLETLLWKCLGVQLTSPSKAPKPKFTSADPDRPIPTKHAIGRLSEAYGYACQLLLELSSFPAYYNKSSGSHSRSDPTPPNPDLPDWLNLLLLCCCFVGDSDFHFISSATVMDLVSITKGVMQEYNKVAGDENDTDKAEVVSVKIAPVLTVEQLMYIEKKTTFYILAASKLWNYLGSETSEHHSKAVQLLVLLQNLSADTSMCERLLGSALTLEDDLAQVEAMNKFSVLWHLTRDIKSKLGVSQNVHFDRCLFLMLDNLERSIGPQKSIAQSWLTHCIQMNDLSRILEPIHLLLLHPDSARVSIQHVQINRPKKVKVSSAKGQSGEDDEAKIYAISSIEGNVIYHVGSDEGKPEMSRIGSPERRILALTSILNPGDESALKRGSKVVTSDSMIQEYDLPSIHDQGSWVGQSAAMSLYMNPFGSLLSVASDSGLESQSTQADLSNAKIVDVASAIRKSSFDLDCDDESNRTTTPEDDAPLSPSDIVAGILDDVIRAAVAEDDSPVSEGSSIDIDLRPPNAEDAKDVAIHPYHTHLLLYYQVYDSEKTLYALTMLKTILSSNPRAVLCAMTTTSVCNVQSSRYVQLLNLLARHKKSVFGKNFHGEVNQSDTSSYRSSMYIEVVILICIYYIRGYYPNNLNQLRLSNNDIRGNRNVQVMSSEVLTIVFSELLSIVKDNSKSLASYVGEVMTKCKLQKTILHCLMASVYNASRRRSKLKGGVKSCFTDAVVDFNEAMADGKECGDNDFADTVQIQLLRLLLVVIVLEDEVFVQKQAAEPPSGKNGDASGSRSSRINFVSSASSHKYQQNVPLTGQPMFLNAVMNALKQQRKSSLLTHWMNLITLSLPYMGKSLSTIVSNVVNQICINLETKSAVYAFVTPTEEIDPDLASSPPDYMIVLLDGLTSLCHYCILENSPQVSTVNQPLNSGTPFSVIRPTQIFSNLLDVFSNSSARKLSSNKETTQQVDPILFARKSLLGSLPRIVSALTNIWKNMKRAENLSSDAHQQSCWVMGNPKVIKQQILGFISPISLNHGVNFLGAVALIWTDLAGGGTKAYNPTTPNSWTDKQKLLVDLVCNIKVMPIDTLVQNVRQVMKNPPSMTSDRRKQQATNPVSLEVNILQFFLAYVGSTSGTQLAESWSSLVPLWKDGLQLSLPLAHFLLLGILNEYVQKTPLSEEKREQRELQEIAQKLIETCGDIAGSSLEQTNWLRRNLAVKTVPQYESHQFDKESANHKEQPNDVPDHSSFPKSTQYSVQALTVLAMYVAPLLDVVYVSEEKDKIVPLLSNIMYYVTPYLKNHSKSNIPSFRACSQLLKSLSGYQYTRRAWKKEAFDLLMDPTFFQIDQSSIAYWRPVIDHLMTHDKLTFRDLMARLSFSQSATLNLFSSKEQEYEQRAQMLKRLAFVIFCSETDQYQRFMPDIQERLSDCLRLQVPIVQSQVFLCFRVMLLRLSSYHITSLWPVIITEMVQIFLQMEQELSMDTEEFSLHIKRLSMMDSSWVVTNGLNAHNSPVWLQLYLSACKLLDLALALPADTLPQFQIYRWAFVGEVLSGISNNNMKKTAKSPSMPDFVPHVTRLTKLMGRKYRLECPNNEPGRPILDLQSIAKIQDLHPFFLALSKMGGANSSGDGFQSNEPRDDATTLQVVEKFIEKDFLE